MNRNIPPLTDNETARALISRAQERCSGCHSVWRLRPATFQHTDASACIAREERQALREIASRNKDDAILKRVREDM